MCHITRADICKKNTARQCLPVSHGLYRKYQQMSARAMGLVRFEQRGEGSKLHLLRTSFMDEHKPQFKPQNIKPLTIKPQFVLSQS